MSKYKHCGENKNSLCKIALFLVAVIACVAVAVMVFLINSDFGNGQNGGSDTQETSGMESAEIVENTGNMEIVEKVDAPYEKWLAAAMVLGISMQYEDFRIDGIYLTGESDAASKAKSQGAYVVFEAGDEQTVLESKPLEAERTAEGTIDLYTKDLGFATFDTVEVTSVNVESCQEITMDDLEDLISQSLLVSLYEH